MFNKGLKDEALKIHEKSVEKYNKTYEEMSNACENLYKLRKSTITLIEDVDALIDSIVNRPNNFSVVMKETRAYKEKFRETEEYAKESLNAAVKSGVGVASGVATGTAIASLAPTAAMWVATTFGTASTGTAISSLSGAVATKAALAWLGGGALSAGGAGVAGGQALLALAGPIGWGIAGASTVVSAVFLGHRNKKNADKAIEEAKKITMAGAQLKETIAKVVTLREETDLLYDNVFPVYKDLKQYVGGDFTTFSDEIKLVFGSLVNDTLALAQMLGKTVE